jgi:hypothetical protein
MDRPLRAVGALAVIIAVPRRAAAALPVTVARPRRATAALEDHETRQTVMFTRPSRAVAALVGAVPRSARAAGALPVMLAVTTRAVAALAALPSGAGFVDAGSAGRETGVALARGRTPVSVPGLLGGAGRLRVR